ncbi:MAG: DUF86 domain-containing protein [Oscillospiraceae bacterium]|nr:DUF86 domain-containing protein [Oscillospiraceae bacterium]
MVDENAHILEKMISHAQRIISYSKEMLEEEFIADSKTAEACVFNLTQIGELTRLLDDSFTNENNGVSWHKMRGLRNRIVHNYEGIDLRLIYDIVHNDIPVLLFKLTNIANNK